MLDSNHRLFTFSSDGPVLSLSAKHPPWLNSAGFSSRQTGRCRLTARIGADGGAECSRAAGRQRDDRWVRGCTETRETYLKTRPAESHLTSEAIKVSLLELDERVDNKRTRGCGYETLLRWSAGRSRKFSSALTWTSFMFQRLSAACCSLLLTQLLIQRPFMWR